MGAAGGFWNVRQRSGASASLRVRALDRFRLERLVKEGEGVSTWFATAPDGSPAVVKLAATHALSPAHRLRLEHEADVLGGLRSPCVAALLDGGVCNGRAFLALERVPGITLQERLRRGPLPIPEAVRLGGCLFRGLETVHAHGVLHRDVKPANLMVDGDRLVLLDFGLSRSALLPPDLARLPAGTGRYLSPEAAGLLPRDVGPASDLYSAGVVLFEAVAGHPPFPQEDLGELLRAHLSLPAPPLPGAPRALQEIVARLLRKDPRDRYRSASAVARDLEDLERALARGESDPDLVPGRHDRRDTLAEPAFVGRTAELRELEASWERARSGHGGVLILGGPSGSGKTRLLEEFARRTGAPTWRGRASETAGSPLQLLASVARAVAWAARTDPELAARVREGARGWEQVCATVLPELSELLETPPRPEGWESFGEASILQGLRAWLASLGPALVLLDDLQWADDLTRRVLGAPGPLGHTLVLAGTREPAPLALSPLAPDEVERLLASMGGALPAEAARLVWELSDGSPFMATEILRGIVQAGILRADDAGWRLEAGSLDRLQTSDRAAVLLRRRLEGMPADTRQALARAALLGREFEVEHLAAVAGQPAGLLPHLEGARRAGVLWSDAAGTRFTFSHDRLRDGCLAWLDPGERTRLHRAAGEWLAERHPEQVHAIAWHFRCAGDPERAAPAALAAASASRARYDLQGAEDNFRVALQGSRGEARGRAAEGLADVLRTRGGYAEARDLYRALLEEASDTEQRARLLLKLSDLGAKQQLLTEARECAEEALRTLGQPVPWGEAGRAAALVGELAVHLLRRGRTGEEPPSARDRLAIRLCERLMVAYFFVDRWAGFAWSHLRGLNLAERAAPSRELATFYGLHVPVAAYLGLLDRATRYGEEGVRVMETVGDTVDQARAVMRAAFADLHAGRLATARDRYGRALSVLRQFGDPWDSSLLRQNLAHALVLSGHLREAADLARETWREGRAVGDAMGMFTSLRYLVRATGGELPEGGLPPELRAVGGDYIRQLYLLEALGVACLHQGHHAAAVRLLEEAVRIGRRRSRPLEYGPTLSWLATALRRQAENLDPASGRPPDLYRRARRAAREALDACAGLPPFRPHALREAGLAAAARGHAARAASLLEQSLALARELGMPCEEALTLRARARVTGTPADEARAQRLLREAGAWWELPEEEPRSEALSRLDRYDQILEAGRRLAAPMPREELFPALVREGERLFRSSTCRVVEEGEGPLRTLAAAAMATPEAVTLEDGLPGGPTDSAILEEVQSALACAIRVQGRPVACLCVTHRDVGGLFTDEDRRLARFLTAMAGAGLEGDLAWRSLQESERSLHGVFEGAGVGLALVDRSGRVRRANPTLGEMLGADPVDLQDFVHREDRAALRRLLAGGSGELRLWGPGDRAFWAQVAVTAVSDGLSVLSVADITPRRLRQVALFQEHERRLLASELHDVVSQPLVALALRGVEGCEDLLRSLSGLVFNLRAPTSIPLAEGVGVLLERFGRETGVATDLEVRGDLDRVEGVPALFVYRILQEALTNVRRHARARRVAVRLEAEGPRVRGTVADDGCGFDPGGREGHYGLVGMRERAELLGGFLKVRRLQPGTEIEFEVQAE